MPKRQYHPPLAISVHGIRTSGRWQKLFASALSGSPTKTEHFDYGRYGLIRFLTPPFNEKMVDRFYKWYHESIAASPNVDLDKYDKRPSVVAHSLGSWIVGQAMLKHEDIRFDKMVLAGSILPRDFDWLTVLDRDQVAAVRNECGQKDPWPRWAGRLVKGTGTGGTEGFKWLGTVEDVRCDWFEHSDSLMRAHIENHWVPFLTQAPSPLTVVHGRNIHDRERFSTMLDHIGTVIDAAVYGDIPHYPDAAIPRGLSMKWTRVNPDIYTYLVDRRSGMPAGYINAMPLEEEWYAAIRQGTKLDREIPQAAIVPYAHGRTVKIYLMSLAIAEKHRRWGEGISQTAYAQLLGGFFGKLKHYAEHDRVRVTHFLANAWTQEGRRMCESFGMTEVGQDRFGDRIFELNLTDGRVKQGGTGPFASLLRTYATLRM